MVVPSRYWKMLLIDAASDGCGYREQFLTPAREFFQERFSQLADLTELSAQQNQDIQASLLACFLSEDSTIDARSQAGFCLRCYVSYSIRGACFSLASQFGVGNYFIERDFLSFVLNDDGTTKIILDGDRQTQLSLHENGSTPKSHYRFFTVEVLQNFNLNSGSQSSLSSWAYYQTRQNPEIKKFLLEQGIFLRSDWAILNRASPKQAELLEIPNAQALVEVFHAVYRRDRRQQRSNRARGCPKPTNAQLREMLSLLQERDIIINSPRGLMEKLRKIATLLREREIWRSSGSPPTEPPEVLDPSTGKSFSREFLDPSSINPIEQMERQKLQEFCEQQLIVCLEQSIEEAICDRITIVKRSRRYGPLAPKVKPGLLLLYCRRISHKEIASELGFNNRNQVGRVLQPTQILNNVRFHTVERLLTNILAKAKDLGLISQSPDYLKNLMEQLEAFAAERVFREAAVELIVGTNRSPKSLYAHKVCNYLTSYRRLNHD